MGRHRRATPVPVSGGSAQRDYDAGRHRSAHRKRSTAPVRTGLLGASAAMAVGAVAVASGLVPGPGNGYTFGGGDDSTSVEAGSIPPDFSTQGTSGIPSARGENPASRDQVRPPAPSPTPSAPAAGGSSASQTPSDEASQTPGETPEKTPGTEKPGAASPDPSAPEQSSPPAGSSSKPSRGAPPPVIPARPSTPPVTTPAKPTPETPGQSGKPSKPTQPGKNATVEAQILALVNAERAKAGCQPVKADRELDELAADFSRDMAVRGFFSHTSPDGESPWDRADAAGVTNLGGENIARGQADAEAVMEAWMQSPGHRANILNCDYKTMGVGAHFEPGGPWWTQNFGF